MKEAPYDIDKVLLPRWLSVYHLPTTLSTYSIPIIIICKASIMFVEIFIIFDALYCYLSA